MENLATKPATVKGRFVSFIKGNRAPEKDAGRIPIERQSSDGGIGSEVETGAEKTFPVSLVNPGGDIFKPYGVAAEEFQREIIALPDVHINRLTICRMTVPSVDAPEIHKTPYCGFPVVKSDTFSVLLSNGELITS